MLNEEEQISLSKIGEALSCPVCRSILSCPHTLPCGHSFCLLCIEVTLFGQDSCPTCDAYTLPKDVKKSMILENILQSYFRFRDFVNDNNQSVDQNGTFENDITEVEDVPHSVMGGIAHKQELDSTNTADDRHVSLVSTPTVASQQQSQLFLPTQHTQQKSPDHTQSSIRRHTVMDTYHVAAENISPQADQQGSLQYSTPQQPLSSLDSLPSQMMRDTQYPPGERVPDTYAFDLLEEDRSYSEDDRSVAGGEDDDWVEGYCYTQSSQPTSAQRRLSVLAASTPPVAVEEPLAESRTPLTSAFTLQCGDSGCTGSPQQQKESVNRSREVRFYISPCSSRKQRRVDFEASLDVTDDMCVDSGVADHMSDVVIATAPASTPSGAATEQSPVEGRSSGSSGSETFAESESFYIQSSPLLPSQHAASPALVPDTYVAMSPGEIPVWRQNSERTTSSYHDTSSRPPLDSASMPLTPPLLMHWSAVTSSDKKRRREEEAPSPQVRSPQMSVAAPSVESPVQAAQTMEWLSPMAVSRMETCVESEHQSSSGGDFNVSLHQNEFQAWTASPSAHEAALSSEPINYPCNNAVATEQPSEIRAMTRNTDNTAISAFSADRSPGTQSISRYDTVGCGDFGRAPTFLDHQPMLDTYFDYGGNSNLSVPSLGEAPAPDDVLLRSDEKETHRAQDSVQESVQESAQENIQESAQESIQESPQMESAQDSAANTSQMSTCGLLERQIASKRQAIEQILSRTNTLASEKHAELSSPQCAARESDSGSDSDQLTPPVWTAPSVKVPEPSLPVVIFGALSDEDHAAVLTCCDEGWIYVPNCHQLVPAATASHKPNFLVVSKASRHNNFHLTERSLLYLKSICLGMTIVRADWLRDSCAAHSLLNHGQYEIDGTIHDTFFRGPYRSRFTQRDHQGRSFLLEDFSFSILRPKGRTDRPCRVFLTAAEESVNDGGNGSNGGEEGSRREFIEEGELWWMVFMCRGAMRMSPPDSSSSGSSSVALSEYEDKTHITLVPRLQSRSAAAGACASASAIGEDARTAVSVSWLLDAISNQRVPESMDNYLMPVP